MTLLYPQGVNYGASPAVFACLGLLAHWLVVNRKLWQEYKQQDGWRYLLYYLILGNVLGISSLIFHLFGFGLGYLFGYFIKGDSKNEML